MARKRSPYQEWVLASEGRGPNADEWNEATKEAGIGSPVAPSYNPALGQMAMPADLKYNPLWDQSLAMLPQIRDMLDMESSGFKRFSKEALRTGESPWSRQMKQASRLEQMAATDRGAAQSRARAAEGRTALAMRGGLTSGARERLAKQSARDYLDMSQQAAREGMMNRAQIGINDEQNRIQQLSMLPGMEAQRVGLQANTLQGDVEGRMRSRLAQNEFDLGMWNKKMETWAADKLAKAQQDSGKK